MQKSLLHVLLLLGGLTSYANTNPTANELYSTEAFLTLELLDENYSTCETEQLCSDVSDNDLIPAGANYALTNPPTEGLLTFQQNGSFCYVPAKVGTFSFSYQICEDTPVSTGPEICEGKIQQMTVQYLGQAANATVAIYGKKNGPLIATFTGVNNGDLLEIDATGLLSGAAATEWSFFVNGSLDAKIHTSCSVDILGKTYGNFYVAAYTDGKDNVNTTTGVDCKTATATIVVNSCGGGTFELKDESYELCVSDDDLCNDVSVNDVLPAGGTYELLSGPAEGSLTLSGDGTFCYIPVKQGTYEFKYQVCESTTVGSGPEICEGKIKQMTVQYLGQAASATVDIYGKNNGPLIATFTGVNNGDFLEIDATGLLSGSAATEWSFFVNGSLDAKIHTSCSVDILGKTYGSFYVAAYTDGKGNVNTTTGVDCKTATATIVVNSCGGGTFELKDESYELCVSDDDLCNDVSVNDVLPAGGTYELLSGPAEGSLTLSGDGTFCYIPVKQGTYEFKYQVCESTTVGSGPEICEGKIKQMTVQYLGQAASATVDIYGKNNGPLIATFTGVNNGDFLEIDATGLLSGSAATEWSFFVNGSLDAKIHTSCSVDILGKTYGSFYVAAYTDGKGNVNTTIAENCKTATATLLVKSCDPCELLGGDTDGDGICDQNDCQPDDPNFPAQPGSACDDNDPNTENDVVSDDGCSCAGTVIEVCDNVGLGGFIGFENCLGSFQYCPLTDPVVPPINNCGDPEGGSGDLEIVWLQSTTSCLPPTTTFENIENDPHWVVIAGADQLSYAPQNITQNTCFLRCVRRAGCTTFVESNIVSLTIDTDCLLFDRATVSIGDRVWEDLNGDGIQDDNEPGLANVYINLQDGNGNSLRWTSTDENGDYIFFNQPAGTYQLVFSTPAGYEVTLAGSGTDRDADSDVDPVFGQTPVLNLLEGDHRRDIDCGYRIAGSFLKTGTNNFNFETVKGEEHTELYWMHDKGAEVLYYAIERSANGNPYEEIISQASQGGAGAELYFDVDLAPVTGDNLYRVKLYRLDGTVAYSDPLLVHFTDLADFTLFPNPASDFIKINLELLIGQRVDIHLINTNGSVVRSVEIEEVNTKYFQIDLREMKEGSYVMWVMPAANKAIAKQFVIGKP